jgi:hypothetical protein
MTTPNPDNPSEASRTVDGRTYTGWLHSVDETLRMVGVNYREAPFFPSWDLWDQGKSPESAAEWLTDTVLPLV